MFPTAVPGRTHVAHDRVVGRSGIHDNDFVDDRSDALKTSGQTTGFVLYNESEREVDRAFGHIRRQESNNKRVETGLRDAFGDGQ